MLTLARLKLKALEGAAASHAPLREVSALLGEAQERAESLMFQLSPPLLRDVGLRAACEWLAEEITNVYGLVVSVDADREHRWADEVVPVTLYRAVRELLLNAAVHADAARADVRIRTEAPMLRITVADDGKGFAPGAEKAFGLSNLEERLNHLGGGLDIATTPTAGTTVTITLPAVSPQTPTEEASS
jgi:signal transduction histidine kinase